MVLNPKSTKKDSVKAVIALVVGLATLGLFIVLLGGLNFWEKLDTYHVKFTTIKDLTTGRPVKFAGLAVGRVQSITLDKNNPGRVLVGLGVEKGFPLYQGTIATISQKGLVGDNYVLLTLEGSPGPKLDPGADIPEQKTLGMNEVAQMIGELVADLKPKLENAATGLELMLNAQTAKKVQVVLAKLPGLVEQLKSALDMVAKDWHTLATEATKSVKQGGRSIKEVGDQAKLSLRDVNANLDYTLDTIDQVLLRLEGELTATLHVINSSVSSTADKVGNLTDDLHLNLNYDQEQVEIVLRNLIKMTDELHRLARSLRERPWQVIYKPEGRPAK